MANNIIKELKSIHKSSMSEPNIDQEQGQSPQTKKETSAEHLFKRYKNMNLKDKARVLIDINEVQLIERELLKMQQLAKQKGIPPAAYLF